MAKKYYAIKKYYDEDTKSYKHNVLLQGIELEKIEMLNRQSSNIFKGFNNKEKAIEYLSKPNVYESEEDIPVYKYVAYVDGSYNNVNNIGSSGSIVLKDNIVCNIECRRVDSSYISNRNLSGELLSVLDVFKYCRKNNIREISVFFDCLGIVTNLLNPENKKDSTLIKYYKRMCRRYLKYIKVDFIHVKSHKDKPYNILIDFTTKSITLAKKSDRDRAKLKDIVITVEDSTVVDTLKEYLQEDYDLIKTRIEKK